MATFKCCYSGLEIKTNHFPMYLSDREQHLACHPIFHASQKSLLAYARKWSANELTSIDSYLLYLALLKSTDLVLFRSSANYLSREVIQSEFGDNYSTLGTDSIVASNMEKLMIAICRINSLAYTRARFPEVIITPENSSLWNSKHWIDNWTQIWKDYHEGVNRQAAFAIASTRELALQKLIRTPHRKVESYSAELAEWCDDVCSFPVFNVLHPFTKVEIPLNEYYKEIIIACAAKKFNTVRRVDLQEVIESLRDCIEFSIDKGQNAGGSIQSFLVFQILEEADKYLAAFIASGSVPASKTPIGSTWSFPDSLAEKVEFTPGVNASLENAPVTEPKLSDFPNKSAYLLAKIKWMATSTSRETTAKKVDAPKGLSIHSLGF